MQVLLTNRGDSRASGSPPPQDRFAADLRGFGPVGIFAILVIFAGNVLFRPLSAVLVLAWAKRSGTPWADIGYVRPKSWIGGVAIGIAVGAAFKVAMKAIVMPLFGADPINHTYHYLARDRAAIPASLFLFVIGAGFGEETVFRGFLFERLRRFVGNGAGSKVLIVALTSAWFGLAHYPDQGLAGAEQAMVTGLVFGTIFAVTGRLWTVMCMHAAFDLTAYAMIYWNLEADVAHLVFK